MSTTTTNLNLVKPEGTEYVDVDVINGNMDIIDEFAGVVSQKPSINSVELSGNKTSAQLSLADAVHTHVMDDITDLPTVPTKTSDLTNDSNFVSDSNYVHTDSNFTSDEKTKLSGIAYNANNYTLPIANTTTLGGIKPDGTTLSVDVNGVASVIGGGGGGGTTVVANPAGEATDVLETIQIGTTVYEAGGSGTEELTLAQYNALTPEQKMLDIHYVIIDVNGNADDYSSIQPIISDAYSSSSTYAVGDYVIRSNRLYKCNTAITEPENWDATKWTETQIVDELGSGSLSGLDTFGIDTSRLITTFSSSVEGTSYTATEDCYVVGELVGYQGDSSTVYIDDVLVFSTYTQSSASANVMHCPLKSGQTIKITAASSTFIRTMSVYGAIKESVNSTIYLPSIYSEEERQIGVWKDGKPLYQKTFVIDTITNGVSYVDSIITSDMEIKHNKGFYIFKSDGTVSPDPHRSGDNTYQCALTNLGYYDGHGVIEIVLGSGRVGAFSGVFTIQYTKTTDTPGSGIWTPSGEKAVHYSTDEQIIGTWVDGKTLYEKTITVSTAVDGLNYVDEITSEMQIKECVGGFTYKQSGNFAVNPHRPGDSTYGCYLNSVGHDSTGGYLEFFVGSGRTNTFSGVFTLQYTKTTD